MAADNKMIVMSKTIDQNGNLISKPDSEFPLADDYSEVRGFGMPLEVNDAKKAVKEFCDMFEKASGFLKALQDRGGIKLEKPEEIEGLEALNILLNPDKFIVSGVFGKEIILQILAQRNCEGIRYNFCYINHELSIVLMGVEDKGVVPGNAQATSEPLFANFIKDEDVISLTNKPLLGEVRLQGLKFMELRNLIEKRSALVGEVGFNDILFGAI